MYGIVSDLGMGPYYHRVRRDNAVAPVGSCRGALAP